MSDPSKSELVKSSVLDNGNLDHAHQECLTAGDWVYLSSQKPIDKDGQVVSSDFSEQVHQTFSNIRTALDEAGSSLSDMVHMTVWLTDMRYSEEFVQLRQEILGDSLTTSSLIGVRSLSNSEHLVEIEVRAIKSSSTMEKSVINVPELRDPSDRGRSYRHCITVDNWVFLAGQVPVDENHDVVSSDFSEQVRAAFKNIKTALSAADSKLDDILHMTVWLRDIRDADKFVEMRDEILEDTVLPASTLIGTRGLANPDYQVEIEVKAVKSNEGFSKFIIDVPEFPSPKERNRSYEPCVATDDHVFLAGQVAFNEEFNLPQGFESQFEEIFKNIEKCLNAAGSSVEDIIHLRVYPADIRYSQKFHDLLKKEVADVIFTNTLVDTAGLANPEFRLEVEVVALRG